MVPPRREGQRVRTRQGSVKRGDKGVRRDRHGLRTARESPEVLEGKATPGSAEHGARRAREARELYVEDVDGAPVGAAQARIAL